MRGSSTSNIALRRACFSPAKPPSSLFYWQSTCTLHLHWNTGWTKSIDHMYIYLQNNGMRTLHNAVQKHGQHFCLKCTVGTPTLQLSFLCLHTNLHTDQVKCSLTTTANHSLTPAFSVYFHEQRKRPPASGLPSESHSYQLCQPANGRAGWTAGDRNKRSPFWPTGFIPALKTEVNCLQRSVTRRLNEWRNDQWSATLESLDPED